MMGIPQHFSAELSLQHQVLFVLSLLKEASVDDITAELIELRGVATEGAVLNLTIEAEDQLEKMHNDGIVKQITEPDKITHFILKPNKL